MLKIQAIIIIILLALVSVLGGCSENHLKEIPEQTETPVIQMISETELPIPEVISEQTEIPITQSSYCWGKMGCADYVGGKTMLHGKTPTVVTPEAKVQISFNYKPAPTQLSVQQFQEVKTVEVPFKDGYFNVPKEKGVYYYGISAYWTTDDGIYSKGDTSSVFVVEVK